MPAFMTGVNQGFVEKLAYNLTRRVHTKEAREQVGGKSF
jgi:hypothetical protein